MPETIPSGPESLGLPLWPDQASEMAALIRSRDWTHGPLGRPAQWGPALRTTVDLVLACQFPMVLLWGRSLVQIYNDGYRGLMGIKHPLGMGQATQECWPEVWNINEPVYERVWQGESITFEDQLFPITRHGFLEDAYFTLCYSPVRDETDLIAGVLVTVLETTALVRANRERDAIEAALRGSEERLWVALSAANGVGIWDWDVVTDSFHADRKFALLYGVDPEAAAGGTPISQFVRNIHADDVERIQAAVAAALESGGAYDEEYRLVQQDGSIRWVAAQGQVLFSPEGKALRFPGVTTDITDLKQAEAALRHSEKLAAVGRLASSMAHEINNPLESVTNLVYLARWGKAGLPAEVEGYLDAAERELRRVSMITNQTLRFYKQSTAPMAMFCQDLIGGTLSILQGRLMNSNVTVEKRKRAQKAVQCFEGEIKQVLGNIVGNAIDSMHPGGGRLLIRSREATSWRTGRTGLVLTVADTGPGMPPRVQQKIFDAFFTTKGIGGTGLGLWVSNEIVERHHGALRVRSSQKPGHSGTVFTVFLPYDAVAR